MNETVISIEHHNEGITRGGITLWVLAIYDTLNDEQKKNVRAIVRRREQEHPTTTPTYPHG